MHLDYISQSCHRPCAAFTLCLCTSLHCSVSTEAQKAPHLRNVCWCYQFCCLHCIVLSGSTFLSIRPHSILLHESLTDRSSGDCEQALWGSPPKAVPPVVRMGRPCQAARRTRTQPVATQHLTPTCLRTEHSKLNLRHFPVRPDTPCMLQILITANMKSVSRL